MPAFCFFIQNDKKQEKVEAYKKSFLNTESFYTRWGEYKRTVSEHVGLEHRKEDEKEEYL